MEVLSSKGTGKLKTDIADKTLGTLLLISV